MAAENNLSHGRSSTRVVRTDTPVSEQWSSFFASKKPQGKPANDKLIWFSPVHSPLLSPAREKTNQPTKKKFRQRSIFSIQNRGKGNIEGEEPTSPKVSCIGQVIPYKKEKDSFADATKKKGYQSRPGSMSPARFFTSPGRSGKWGSLFGSRKDSGAATPSSSGYGEGEASCFGWPFESRSAFHKDKTCAFLARSLNVFNEYGDMGSFCNPNATQSRMNAPGEEGTCSDKCIRSCTEASEKPDRRTLSPAQDSNSYYNVPGVNAHEISSTSLLSERGHGLRHQPADLEPCQLADSAAEDHIDGKAAATKHRLKYEELPSLHCGAHAKKDMKISVEVVPETWLCRDGERLQPNCASHATFVPERRLSLNREDCHMSLKDGASHPVRPCDTTQVLIKASEESIHQQSRSLQQHRTAHLYDESCSTSVNSDSSRLADKKANILLAAASENRNVPVCASTTKSGQSHRAALPSCRNMAVNSFEEENGELRVHSGVVRDDGGKQQDLSDNLHNAFDPGKSQGMPGISDVKWGQPYLNRFDIGLGKENYSIALPQLLEKNISSLHSVEDGKRFWNIFKSKRSKSLSPQPFGAVILLGYDQSTSLKDMRQSDEELLKGILEVGRLSFHGSGKHFQVLKGDTGFNRSRSATSHRTVMRLQRCNSDPCRSLC